MAGRLVLEKNPRSGYYKNIDGFNSFNITDIKELANNDIIL